MVRNCRTNVFYLTMGYIKIRLRSRTTDGDGFARQTTIARFESDMPPLGTYEMNLLWHALSLKGEIAMAGSCFGSGRWIDDEPWLDDDVWRDEP